jgi:hypothetical protein
MPPAARRFVQIIAVPGLHAKFYLALGRDFPATEGLVTSANLTTAGTTANVELGIWLAASSMLGARLLHELDRFSRRLVA